MHALFIYMLLYIHAAAAGPVAGQGHKFVVYNYMPCTHYVQAAATGPVPGQGGRHRGRRKTVDVSDGDMDYEVVCVCACVCACVGVI